MRGTGRPEHHTTSRDDTNGGQGGRARANPTGGMNMHECNPSGTTPGRWTHEGYPQSTGTKPAPRPRFAARQAVHNRLSTPNGRGRYSPPGRTPRVPTKWSGDPTQIRV